METKIALLVIYNHRFDKNIPLIDDLYKGRFSNLFHIVPFYDGKKKNVIPVYESSYYFQGYISQAYTHLRDNDFTHYFVVADDMVINPAIDENNIWEKTGLGYDDCFIDLLRPFQEDDQFWLKAWAMAYNPKQRGVEILKVLPDYKKAIGRFKQHNLPVGPIPWRRLLMTSNWRDKFRMIKWWPVHRHLKYPLVGSYADILMITKEVMPDFSKYCGAFSATKLFVEIAAPTALVLSADNIKQSKDLKLHSRLLWGNSPEKFGALYGYSIERLINEYPENVLFVHPIKYSKWK